MQVIDVEPKRQKYARSPVRRPSPGCRVPGSTTTAASLPRSGSRRALRVPRLRRGHLPWATTPSPQTLRGTRAAGAHSRHTCPGTVYPTSWLPRWLGEHLCSLTGFPGTTHTRRSPPRPRVASQRVLCSQYPRSGRRVDVDEVDDAWDAGVGLHVERTVAHREPNEAAGRGRLRRGRTVQGRKSARAGECGARKCGARKSPPRTEGAGGSSAVIDGWCLLARRSSDIPSSPHK